MSYSLQRVSQDRIPDLQVLFRDSFNWRPSAAYLHQKYDTRALGPVDLGYLAYADDGVPAAYYGVFAVQLRDGEKIISGAQSGDTATHSQHRGKGLFITLAKASYELARNEGVEVVFGFPNKNSYPGFVKKLDWSHTHDLDIFRVKVFTLPMAKLVRKLPALKGLYNFWTRIFVRSKLAEKDFPGSVVANGQNGVIRDHAYFKYKKSADKHLVEHEGMLIWLKFDGYLWVGDMEITTPEKLEKNLAWLRRIAFLTGCNTIVFQASPGTKLNTQLRQLITPHGTMPAGGVKLNPASMVDLHSLLFTGADFDNW